MCHLCSQPIGQNLSSAACEGAEVLGSVEETLGLLHTVNRFATFLNVISSRLTAQINKPG